MESVSGNPSGEEEALKDEIAQLKADLARLRDDLRADARAVARDAGGVASSAGAVAKDRVREAVESAIAGSKEDIERLERQIKDHPLASIGIALGVGLVVGALFAKS
jgi:ElaB/YqjD/DUF883 family membrane-anchored ribosome-binding protein